ncbi:MAG: galactokinase, partial [Clostridia bacterium]|nr:galactokinase [Clostridia bacterium]
KKEFVKYYGGSEDDIRIFMSPGRVNLIGEHTDYCGGFVFPAAITMGTYIAARKTDDKIIKMRATDLPDYVEADATRINDYKHLSWGNYQLGVAAELEKRGYEIVGCELLYDDTIPHGGGLSSSAAIEVATAITFATFSNELKGIDEPLDMIEMALCGQGAENNYCGVNCGIMDQFASAMGKKDHVIFLDCKKLEDYKLVPLKMDGYKIVISNTNKKRSLADSKYNERRAETEEGFAELKEALPNATCLGDISLEEFEANKHLIKRDIVRQRVTHVIEEDDRVLKSIEALQNGDILEFGRLINASGDSLRDLYEVTGKELDTLVAEARKIDGTIGSRMTGAGFGGCTMSIVREDAVDTFIAEVGTAYNEIIGYPASFYVDDIGDGGHEVK